MTNDVCCERCLKRLEDCECEPGFPAAFCADATYDPDNHNPDTCTKCKDMRGHYRRFEAENSKTKIPVLEFGLGSNPDRGAISHSNL